MTFFAEIAGQRLTSVNLHVPNRGAWFALCDFESAAPDVSGRVTLSLGKSSLVGSLVSAYTGAFGEQKRAMLVGGGGGWGNTVIARSYHNDAGVKAVLLAQDLAREVGETLGAFTPTAERVGIDYVRGGVEREASQLLEDVIGEALWWVDFAGTTQVGERPTAPALLDGDYRVLHFNPRTRVAQLSLTDPSLLRIGSVLASPALPEAQTVREYEVQADAAGMRVLAWCGGSGRSAGRLAELWRRLATRVSSDSLFGLYRYRVVSMAVDGRVTLQGVRKAAGLPDIASISQWPGVAGAHAELTPGAEVLVAFVEGDRTMPVVTHYAGKDGAGFVPVTLTLGGSVGSPAARQGDTVQVLLPPAVISAQFVGTVDGAPATGTVVGAITFPLNSTLGSITTGSSKVKVAT